jgi:DNA-binding IclR family transcriptional regulator
MSILDLLARSKDGSSAADIGALLGMSHEDTYAALVALESRGAVRVMVDFTDKRTCSGVKRWELMPAGVRMMFAHPQELEPA